MFSKTSALIAATVVFLATAGSAEAVESPFAQMSGDRKSTRLNSSHT